MGALLSFDIWDTLLRRHCHPDEVKLFTARCVYLRFHRFLRDASATPWSLFQDRVRCEREIGQALRERSGLDDEYEIQEVLAKWLGENVTLPSSRRIDDVAAELADLEVRQEIRLTYVDEVAASLLRQTNGSRVIAISDFYMGEQRLRRILEAKAPKIRFDRVLVSCDVKLNKRSGRVLTYAQDEFGADTSTHVHIGNSVTSDVKPAEALGMRAVHFRNAPEDARQAAHERRFAERPASMASTNALLQTMIEAACSVPAGYDERQAALYRAGARFSPVIAGLVLISVEEAIKQRVNSVFYCTREGDFFAEMHKAMAPRQPHGTPMPEAVKLHVSRISTFFPSLREFSTKELMRIWNMYSWQSIRQLLTSFHVPTLPVEPFLAKHSIELEEEIRYPWKDARIRSLFNDPLFQRLLFRWRRERRRDLYAYFASRGFTKDQAHAVVVDIGWRGTILDNIAHLFPRTRMHGFYLGLLNMLNEQPRNAVKASIGPDARYDSPFDRRITRWVAPFEMLCNSPNGSVRGYVRTPERVWAAETLENPGETRVHEQYTQYFQAGALAAAPVIAEWVRRHAVTSAEMKPLIFELMREMSSDPPTAVAEAFFQLSHNETFGQGGFHDKRRQLPRRLLSASRRSPEVWRELVAFVEETTWPQGFLKLNGRHRELARYLAEADEGPSAPTPGQEKRLRAAEAALEELERSLTWRVLTIMKRLTPYAIYARLRWGPHWDAPPNESTIERFHRLHKSRTYAMVSWLKSTFVYRAYGRLRRGSS